MKTNYLLFTNYAEALAAALQDKDLHLYSSLYGNYLVCSPLFLKKNMDFNLFKKRILSGIRIDSPNPNIFSTVEENFHPKAEHLHDLSIRQCSIKKYQGIIRSIALSNPFHTDKKIEEKKLSNEQSDIINFYILYLSNDNRPSIDKIISYISDLFSNTQRYHDDSPENGILLYETIDAIVSIIEHDYKFAEKFSFREKTLNQDELTLLDDCSKHIALTLKRIHFLRSINYDFTYDTNNLSM